MPRHYYLFRGHNEPFANPLPADKVLFRVAQISIHDLRTRLYDDDEPGNDPDRSHESFRVGRQKIKAVVDCAVRFACVELLNRVLVSSTPTEAHWDYAATKIGQIAIEFAYYMHFEAFRTGMWYSEKRLLEALVSEWLDEAKDIWRMRLLYEGSEELVEFGMKDWRLPSAPTFLREQLFLVPPDTVNQPPEITEELYRPASYSAEEEGPLESWTANAFSSVAFEHDFMGTSGDCSPADLSTDKPMQQARQSFDQKGGQPNRAWFERVRDKYRSVKKADLTLSALSQRANYEFESNTDVKAWLGGRPRTGQANRRITDALSQIESELLEDMS